MNEPNPITSSFSDRNISPNSTLSYLNHKLLFVYKKNTNEHPVPLYYVIILVYFKKIKDSSQLHCFLLNSSFSCFQQLILRNICPIRLLGRCLKNKCSHLNSKGHPPTGDGSPLRASKHYRNIYNP